MAEYDYSFDYGFGTPYDDWSGGGEMYAGGSPTFNEGGGDYFNSPAYQTFIGQGDPYGPGSSGDPNFEGEGSGGFFGGLGSVLGGLGGFLGQNAATIGPLLSGAGSLAGGAIGSNAANEAARLQSQALNRGIDLQTAQWLQQQQNLAPYLQAGQGGLAQLQQLAGREQPGLPGTPAAISGANYALPSTTPGWQPQTYQGPQGPNAGDYRWMPGQGPQAANYRYTPGDIPRAATYRYTPGAVPTLSGQELLANDPGYQFRMDESRKALEGSAAARGDLLSGGNLKALQSRSQDLASQEYGNAWQRAAEQARLREGWAQQASQMGFGQAMSEAEMRERVNQVATQQGWSQAQAEAVFREQMGQQASQQGFNQALAGQQNQFTQGLQAQQWNVGQQQRYETDMYNRMLEQNKYRYGQDVAQQGTDYERQQNLYRQQLAQHLLPWEQASTLANLGGQAVNMYGAQGGQASRGISDLLAQLGSAQGVGAYGSGLNWQRALTGAANQGPSLLAGLNA